MSCFVFPVLILFFLLISFTSVTAVYHLDSLRSTDSGWEGLLTSDGNASLNLSVWYEEDYRIRVTLRPTSNKIWEVPASLFKTPTTPPTKAKKPIYNLQFSSTGTDFLTNVTRGSATGAFAIEFQISNFTARSQPYISTRFTIPQSTGGIYGVGDRVAPLPLPVNQPLNLWNRPNSDIPLQESSGSHPIVHVYDKSGTVYALIMRNSSPQRFREISNEGELPYLHWEAWGGVVDFYLLFGPAPSDIATQLAQVIGFPAMPPLWALGYHQSRWGYKSAQETQQVLTNYLTNEIPLDSIWNDVDYEDHFFEYTFDPARYNITDIQKLQFNLHTNEKRHILLLNPSIPALLQSFNDQPYTPYTSAKQSDILILHPNNKTSLYTYTQPNVTSAIIDYTNPHAEDWLTNVLTNWLEKSDILLDGAGLNSNEVFTACDGEFEYSCNFTVTGPSYSISPYSSNVTLDPAAAKPTPPSSDNPIPEPQFYPSNHSLDYQSINISAYLKIGREYDAHNLYGLYQSIVAYSLLQKKLKERPLVWSRSTWLGSGQWVATSVTGNSATWEDLRNSIPQVIRSGLAGITMAGADVCGYNGDATAELCARWHQLAAFYPFMRNHNTWNTASQEAYSFPEPYLSVIRTAINIRYVILPYIYTLLSEGHISGTPLFRQLSWDFPKDPKVYDIDTQFMFGPGFLISPILMEGANSVEAYVPAGIWYNATTFEQVVSKGEMMTFYSALSGNSSSIPILIQSAHFLCQQYPNQSTIAGHKNPFFYTVALDSTYIAHGHNVYDDGYQINALEYNNYYRINSDAEFQSVGGGKFTGNIDILTALRYPAFDVSTVYLRDIYVLGLNGISSVPETWLSMNGTAAINITSSVFIGGAALVISDPTLSLMLYTGNIRLTFGKKPEIKTVKAMEE